jgi:hypothetical protein
MSVLSVSLLLLGLGVFLFGLAKVIEAFRPPRE